MGDNTELNQKNNENTTTNKLNENDNNNNNNNNGCNDESLNNVRVEISNDNNQFVLTDSSTQSTELSTPISTTPEPSESSTPNLTAESPLAQSNKEKMNGNSELNESQTTSTSTSTTTTTTTTTTTATTTDNQNSTTLTDSNNNLNNMISSVPTSPSLDIGNNDTEQPGLTQSIDLSQKQEITPPSISPDRPHSPITTITTTDTNENNNNGSQNTSQENLQNSINKPLFNPRIQLINNGGGSNKSTQSGLDVHKYRTFILNKLQSTSVKDDPLADEMIHLPKDDLQFTKTEIYHRIISTGMSLPPGIPTVFFNQSEYNQHIKTSIETFNAPRKSIIRNYEKFKKDQDRISLLNPEMIDRYECDLVYEKELLNSKLQQSSNNQPQQQTPPPSIHSSRNSGGILDEKDLPQSWVEAGDDLHFEYQQPITSTTDEENNESRKKQRLSFFKYFKPDYNWGSGTEVSLCSRTPVEHWKRPQSTSVLIEFKGLVFLLGEHEPFYCQMFLFDSINKTRLSEVFHFDFNSDRLKQIIDNKDNEDSPDYLTQCKHVLVSLPQKQTKDIWIVVRVNKIMQGDPDLIKEPYTKLDEKETAKSKVKVSTNIQDIGKRLGRFHQSFSITALPLTTETGNVKVGTHECDLYRQVPKDLSDLQELVNDLKDSSKKKKLKTLLGAFTCIIHKTEGDLPPYGQRLDPSYNFIKSSEPYNHSSPIDSNKTYNNVPITLTPTNTSSNNTTTTTTTTTSSSINPTNTATTSTSELLQQKLNESPTITLTTPDCTPPLKSIHSSTSVLSMSSNNAFSPPSPTLASLEDSPTLSPRRQLQHSSSYSNSIKRGNTLIALNSIIPAIREIQCFSKFPELIPHHQLFNNLYIYPDIANLNKAHGRNITIKIEIREDDILSNPPLKFIYGKSSCQRFTQVYYTETHYHNKNPLFFDEIKIKLPPILPQKLHILFTFYHVVCKVGKRDETSENIIGFSAIPLYREKKFVDSGQHGLQLAVGHPKDKYLTKFHEDYTLLENGKTIFKFDLKLLSSIYPQNTHINRFLLNSKDDLFSDKELTQTLNQFILFDPLESIKFFPVIMNHLLFVICNRESTIGSTAIKALLILLTKIQNFLEDTNIRVSFLSSYINHYFDNPQDTKMPVHTALCQRLVLFLMRKRSNDFTDISNSSIFSFSWFIYDLIVKSIGLYKLDGRTPIRDGATSPSAPFFEIIDPEFIKFIPKLVSFGLSHILGAVSQNNDCRLASDANNNLALFIRDLFSVFDRGVVVDLLFTFLNDINQGIAKDPLNSTTFLFYKFHFLKIICDYEHYINLNIPTLYSINNIQNLSSKINDTHPISGILIREVLDIIFQGGHSVEVRNIAFSTLNTIITKHDYDQRYQNTQKKERIASIYFPLILELIDHQDKFNNWFKPIVSDITEKRLFISCVLFVLKNLSKQLLKQWFNKEVPQRLNILFEILGQFTIAFEYQQNKEQFHIGSTSPETLSTNNSGGINVPPPPTINTSGKLSKDILMRKGTALSPQKYDSSLNLLRNSSNISKDQSQPQQSSPSQSINQSSSIQKQLLQQQHQSQVSLQQLPNGQQPLPSQQQPQSSQSSSSGATINNSLHVPISVSSSFSNDLLTAFANAPIKEASNSYIPVSNFSPGSSSSSQFLSVPPPPPQTSNESSSTGGGNRSNRSSFNGSTGIPMMMNGSTGMPATPYKKVITPNEPILTAEANLIILDFVEDFIKYQYPILKEINSPVFEKIFHLVITLLSKRQSHRVTHCLFASLRSFVHKFRKHFFKDNSNNYCNLLCTQILRYCNFPSKEIRAVSTSFLYSMIKLNNQMLGNFGRMKIQATIALSNLASSGAFKNDFKNLERSFHTLSKYSLADLSREESDSSIIPPELLTKLGGNREEIYAVKKTFSIQIQKMSLKLSKIIRDTVRVNMLEKHSDPETIHELFSEIAAGYSDTPEIRSKWLNFLSIKHIEEENYFEAAVCKLRIALLNIIHLEQTKKLPCQLDLSILEKICPGMKEQVVEEDDVVYQSSDFSIIELLSNVLLATNLFRMGEYFEYSILLYKLLMPLYEKNRDFQNLSECHKQITDLYKEIIKACENKSRMLGRYYRVGFYGDAFEDLDGQEFIYKEPKLTHLFVLSERLKTFYREKFHQEVVVFPDSGKIERSTLDPTRLYLQITSLKPYFDDNDFVESRPDYFERHTLLKNFVFITPFTLNGRTQGTITEQFHRKTILTIENTAPNMLKRYLVTSKKEIEISPIENSIETIQQRNNLLSIEINQNPPNIKTLQGVLQGSVLLQVNAGALEICRGFLANQMRPNWPVHHVEKLAQECSRFLKLCKLALEINKYKIQMNQYSFHQELESGYNKLSFKMERYIKGEISNESDEEIIDQDQQPETVHSSYGIEDESSLITDLSYDDDISIKESSPNNLFDSLLPNLKKKTNGHLTIKEDKRIKRGSTEFDYSIQTPRSIDKKLINNH